MKSLKRSISAFHQSIKMNELYIYIQTHMHTLKYTINLQEKIHIIFYKSGY